MISISAGDSKLLLDAGPRQSDMTARFEEEQHLRVPFQLLSSAALRRHRLE